MLNPGDYIQFCEQQELDSLILAPFPWDRIVRSTTFRIRQTT